MPFQTRASFSYSFLLHLLNSKGYKYTTLSFFLHFNGHFFPGGSGLASDRMNFIGAKDGSDSQIVTTNKPTPNFLQTGCPFKFCYPINSVKALKGKKTQLNSL